MEEIVPVAASEATMASGEDSTAVAEVAAQDMEQDEQIILPLPQQNPDGRTLMACPDIKPAAPPSRRLPVGFELRRSDSSQDTYMFNPYTGETVYGITADEDLTKVSRLRSFWRKPERELVEYMKLIAKENKARRQSEVGVSEDNQSSSSRLNVEQAASVLLKLGRRILAMSRAYKKVTEFYEKRVDHQSGYYYYFNKVLQTSQWHKPVVLASYKDLPLTQDFDGEASSEQSTEKQMSIEQQHSEQAIAGWSQQDALVDVEENEECGDLVISPYDQNEEQMVEKEKAVHALASRGESGMFLGRTPHTRHYNRVRFQQGPLYHRIGPCRKTGFIRGNNFTKMKPFSDQLIVRQMPEIDTDTTLLNGKFVLEEGFARRQVMLNEYLLPRTMSLYGAEKVLLTMKTYPENVELTLNCLLQLSKFKYEATSEGAATYLAVEVIDTGLHFFNSADYRLRLSAMALLSIPLTEFGNRAVFRKKDGIKVVCEHLAKVKTKKQHVKFNNEQRVVESISTYHVSSSYHLLKLVTMLSYDEPREAVAEECTDLVINAMDACRDDAEVLMEGFNALYNFVFLCENNHILLTEKEVLSKVERWLEAYASDKELLEAGKRTILALQPDGWRANFNESSSSRGASRNSSRPSTKSTNSRPSTKGQGNRQEVEGSGSVHSNSRPSTVGDKG